MAEELERKYLEVDFDALKGRIKALGGTQVEKPHFESNAVYDTLEESLLSSGRLLRLRVREWPGKKDVRVTAKRRLPDPLVAGRLAKRREEFETQVGDEAVMAGVFDVLGYVKVASYEKVRESWTLLGAHIDMDILPFGKVVEIEAEAGLLEKVEKALMLEGVPTSAGTYGDLHREWLRSRSLPYEKSFVFEEGERLALRRRLGL